MVKWSIITAPVVCVCDPQLAIISQSTAQTQLLAPNESGPIVRGCALLGRHESPSEAGRKIIEGGLSRRAAS